MNEALRWNIVWISLEDTSPRFGCCGDQIARTPNIDRLASEGTLYEHAYSTAAVCAPSRSSIITGMYQTSIGTMHMRTAHTNPYTPELPTPYSAVPPAYVKAFPEYLRAAGYYCTNNAKTDYQFDTPLTAWDECGEHAHWRNRKANQPFFAVFNPTITHESGMWTRQDEPLLTNSDELQLPPYLPDTPQTRRCLARHYDNIAIADQKVGEILNQLEKDGLTDQTIVFLWSDHGEGLPRAKRWLYDAGIRVPLIVKHPGEQPSGTILNRLVSLVDLAPTVLELAGVEAPCHFQGRSFAKEDNHQREYIFAARDRFDEAYDMMRAVRDKRYKYIRNYHPELPYLLWIPYSHQHPILQEMWRLHLDDKLEGPQTLMFKNKRPAEELYDCENDPYELNNLASDPACRETLGRMRSALDEWRSQYGDLGDIPESRLVRQMWPDGVQPETAKPIFIPVTKSRYGTEPMHEGSFTEPALIMFHCATQGSSIAYKIEDEAAAGWSLYTGPIRLPEGKTEIRAKAVRIGYKDSEEATGHYRLHINDQLR